MAENTETPVQEEAQAQEEAAKGPELSVQDLLAVQNIIDVASQRGAFKAGELEAVGKAFNKLSAFLEAVKPQEEAPATEA